MAELANCSRCGKVFAKVLRDICQDCYKEEEEDFKTVYSFLKDQKKRQATIAEIVEGTGVEEKLIIKFVREGRLRPSEFPNLSYPCERCGTAITTGKYCKKCISEMRKELQMHESSEKVSQEKNEIDTYYAINKRDK